MLRHISLSSCSGEGLRFISLAELDRKKTEGIPNECIGTKEKES